MLAQARSIRFVQQIFVIVPIDVAENHISTVYSLAVVAVVATEAVKRKAQAESQQQINHKMKHHAEQYQQQVFQFEPPEAKTGD